VGHAENDPPGDQSRRRRVVERVERRHREHRHEAQDRRLREDLARAGYDVETDTGIQTGREADAAYDVETDTADEVRPQRPSPPELLDGADSGPD
jgi:hypothetical protein